MDFKIRGALAARPLGVGHHVFSTLLNLAGDGQQRFQLVGDAGVEALLDLPTSSSLPPRWCAATAPWIVWQ